MQKTETHLISLVQYKPHIKVFWIMYVGHLGEKFYLKSNGVSFYRLCTLGKQYKLRAVLEAPLHLKFPQSEEFGAGERKLAEKIVSML